MTPALAVKIITVLQESAAVFALVGARIFPDHAPDGVTQRPFIVWIDTHSDAEESFDDVNNFDASEVRFNCYSDNKLEAMQVRSAVRAALTVSAAMSGVTISRPQTRGLYDDKVSLSNAILELTFLHNPSET